MQADSITAAVATTVPVSLTVVDSAGTPVPDQVISFAVTAGGGTVFAAAAQSSASGVVSDQWTMGTAAGRQTLEARWVDPVSAAARVLASITATATPGALAHWAFGTSGARWSALVATPLTTSAVVDLFGGLRATDAYGNPVDTAGVVYSTTGAAALAGGTLDTSVPGLTAFSARLLSLTATDSLAIDDDMRGHEWRFSYRCLSDALSSGDSTTVVATGMASSYLTSSPGTVRQQIIVLAMSGVRVVGGPALTSSSSSFTDSLRIGEDPDTVSVFATGGLTTAGGATNASLGRTSSGVLVFSGPTWCDLGWQTRGATVLEAITP